MGITNITIDETINMFEEAIKANETDFPNEYRQIVEWLKDYKRILDSKNEGKDE